MAAPRSAAWSLPPVRAASCCPAPRAQRAAFRRAPFECSRTTRTLDIAANPLEDLRLVVQLPPELLDVRHLHPALAGGRLGEPPDHDAGREVRGQRGGGELGDDGLLGLH